MLPSHLSFIECLYLVLSMPVFFVVSCSYRSLLIKFMEPSYASIDYGRLEQSLFVFLLRLVKYRYRSMFVIAISFSHCVYIYILFLDVPLCSLLCVTIWTGILAALPVLISVVNLISFSGDITVYKDCSFVGSGSPSYCICACLHSG